MCGIAGIVNFDQNIIDKKHVLDDMIKTLKRRGPDSEGTYITQNVLLGHRRLIVVDPSGGIQPMTKSKNEKKYTIVYNGELYNTDELREDLKKKGYTFNSYSDTEVLLTSYMEYKRECLNKLIGIFAFAIYDEERQEVFIARDQMGVKPLFYTIYNNTLLFGSEIKTLFADKNIKREIDLNGLTEIFALGPATIPGSGVFKNIKEVAPANYIVYKKGGKLEKKEYWSVKAEKFEDTAEEAIIHTRELVTDAVKRQLVGDVPLCTLLSGGLDSSIISKIAADEFKKRGRKLTTYSIDYVDNDKYFKASLFQPTSDEYYAEKMAQDIGSNHKKVVLTHKDLYYALLDSVDARSSWNGRY